MKGVEKKSGNKKLAEINLPGWFFGSMRFLISLLREIKIRCKIRGGGFVLSFVLNQSKRAAIRYLSQSDA